MLHSGDDNDNTVDGGDKRLWGWGRSGSGGRLCGSSGGDWRVVMVVARMEGIGNGVAACLVVRVVVAVSYIVPETKKHN